MDVVKITTKMINQCYRRWNETGPKANWSVCTYMKAHFSVSLEKPYNRSSLDVGIYPNYRRLSKVSPKMCGVVYDKIIG